jgi:hypothetical protein
MSATARPHVEADAREWLAGEIRAGRLLPIPSPEVLGRIAAMLTGPVRSDEHARVRKPIRPVRPDEGVMPAEVDGLPVTEERPAGSQHAT